MVGEVLFLPPFSVMELRNSEGGIEEHGVVGLIVTWWLQKLHVKSWRLGTPAPSALTGSALQSGPALARAQPRPLIGSRRANQLSRRLGALMLTLFWWPGYPGRAGFPGHSGSGAGGGLEDALLRICNLLPPSPTHTLPTYNRFSRG